ncbi:MAG: TetR/AcrR family transcriptional regulator [Myxococcota bacterium]
MARGALRTRRAGKPARRRAPEASRDAILDAALRCFAKRGYHETSVDDIAARARLSKGAVYWHFAGKRALFLALMDRALAAEAGLAAAVAGAPDWRAALRELFAQTPEYIERELPLVKLSLQHLLQDGLDDAVRARSDRKQERWNAIVEQQLARGVADGSLRALAPEDVTLAIGAVITGFTIMRLTRPDLKLGSAWRAAEEILGRGIRA